MSGRVALLLACSVAGACGNGGDLAVGNVRLASGSSACGCWDGVSLTLVAGCALTLTGDVVTLDGAPSAAADGSPVEVRLTRLGTPSEPAAEVLATEARVSDGAVAIPWDGLVEQDTPRAQYILALTLGGNQSLVPLAVLAPQADAPYVLCAYWTDPGDVVLGGTAVARGAEVRLVTRLTGNLGADFEVAVGVVTAEDQNAYSGTLPADLASDHATASFDWVVPRTVETASYFGKPVVKYNGGPFDQTTSGPLHVSSN